MATYAISLLASAASTVVTSKLAMLSGVTPLSGPNLKN